MKIAALSAAFLGSQLFVIPVSDRVPELKVEAQCQATTATDKAMGLSESQSFADCMRDETDARQQLQTLWTATPGPVRDSCLGEATGEGSPSYVDLLTCIQMRQIASATPTDTAPKLRGASKNRNKQQ
ncbi:hypothetical protein [Bradyrhizobium sp. CCGUVB14]|uniref:hypothetical protein n=1 Tax=Bradyrhizobium sp. CCGUVB14 TaxID=2949628 RepID=UPI0020B1F869|nr:hypothetical protein [Bradyrhizobium sp. CCGUVB14]MCP3444646.1 hypothetical protein [Bradyrhizobium sp. CCGUVB14]